jgi:hypothetical protein
VIRVASLTAEPTPAFAADTAPMIDSVAGALVRTIPDPMKTIEPAIVTWLMLIDAVEAQASPDREADHSASDHQLRPASHRQPGADHGCDPGQHRDRQEPDPGGEP